MSSPTPKPVHTFEDSLLLRERSASLASDFSSYLSAHPELSSLLNDFVADVLLHKPTDVYAHANQFFSRISSINQSNQQNSTSAASSSNSDNGNVSKKNPHPIVVCGPSGVGKGTLIGKLMSEYPSLFGFSVSHTTRAPRSGEEHGIHYNFSTHEEMEKLKAAGGFVETALVHGNMYGTSFAGVGKVAESGKACILDIDVQGAQSVKKSPLNAVYLFVRPPGMEELEKRLRGRGTESEEKIQLRLGNAKAELEFCDNNPGFFDHVIVNDNLEKTYASFKEIALKAANGSQ
eukprot:ANDGO_04779.mRNA.1 Guanylate kinase 1